MAFLVPFLAATAISALVVLFIETADDRKNLQRKQDNKNVDITVDL